MCRISEDYFRKICKTTLRISPRKYINELKISYSEELIKSGIYTVTEAAELSDYTDMSYLSREFKKQSVFARLITGKAYCEYIFPTFVSIPPFCSNIDFNVISPNFISDFYYNIQSSGCI